MKYIKINENGIHIVFGITDKNQIKLLHFSKAEFDENDICKFGKECKAEDLVRKEQFIDEAFQLVQVNLAGYNRPYEKHGNKHICTAPGYLLTYAGMEDSWNEIGRKITIYQEDKEETHVRVETRMQFYKGTSIVRMVNKVINEGDSTQCLEYLSSFCYTGIEKEGKSNSDAKMRVRIPYNGWQKEMSIKEYKFGDVGLAQTQPGVYQRTSQVLEVSNTGNWSTKKYLPLGYVENTEAHTSLFWQIEHNGSWHYEISDQNTHFYVCVSGPTEVQSHWFKNLAPGESFESVPVAVGVADDSFEKAMGELTKYRRMIRRPNKDDENLPVIFNDYMNCLFGDPTTEKELPLIDAAAECGCEYYVIDAGWYAPGEWWDSVGEWQESRERFPNGIKEVTDYIRQKGQGIVLFDYDNHLILHNDRADDFLGKELLCKCENLQQFLETYDLSVDLAADDDSFSLQCYIKGDDGDRPLRCDIRRLDNKEGRRLGQMFVFSDISLETDMLTGFQKWDSFQRLAMEEVDHFTFPVGVAICDINGLSVINSTRSNQAGDQRINALAGIMRKNFPERTYYVRGIDAHLIALCSHSSEEEMTACVEKVKEQYDGSIQYAVGVAADEGQSIVAAITDAATAMKTKKLVDSESSHFRYADIAYKGS